MCGSSSHFVRLGSLASLDRKYYIHAVKPLETPLHFSLATPLPRILICCVSAKQQSEQGALNWSGDTRPVIAGHCSQHVERKDSSKADEVEAGKEKAETKENETR